jgi:DNA-binding response OmpR family regulator
LSRGWWDFGGIRANQFSRIGEQAPGQGVGYQYDRRSGWTQQPPSPGVQRFGDLEVELDTHTVRVRGDEVKLTPTEFALLAHLVANPKRVLTHRMLLQRVWGEEYGDEPEYLRVYINSGSTPHTSGGSTGPA